MFELLDEWKFLAGLGIFLFGMFMMEEQRHYERHQKFL